METERARSSSLEKRFSEHLEELRMEGSESASRGAGHDLPTLLAAERLKVIELEKTVDNLKNVSRSLFERNTILVYTFHFSTHLHIACS